MKEKKIAFSEAMKDKSFNIAYAVHLFLLENGMIQNAAADFDTQTVWLPLSLLVGIQNLCYFFGADNKISAGEAYGAALQMLKKGYADEKNS